MSEEALKWLRKEEKRKAKEKRKDTPILIAEFQRTERRDKKAFLSEQCKEIEENNITGRLYVCACVCREGREISSRKLEIPRERFLQR